MKKKKYKFNYYRFTMCLLVLGGIIYFAVKYTNQKKYEESIEYKLIQKGYEQSEIDTLKKHLNDKQVKSLLNREYNKYLVEFTDEKYFMFKNLDKYLDYKKQNKKEDDSKIVAIINTEANVDWYDNEKESDTSKEELMIVNRLYSIGEYEPEDVIDAPIAFAYNNIKLKADVLPVIEELIGDAKEAGYSFILSNGYRSYEEQEKLYNKYVNSYGQQEADAIVARPGHSEYQTGLTFDLGIYGKSSDKPEETEEYQWLMDNIANYGFIVRHTKEKENLTGYSASSWKLRYVGEEAAQKMKEEDLCFEEYYAYYVVGDK